MKKGGGTERFSVKKGGGYRHYNRTQRRRGRGIQNKHKRGIQLRLQRRKQHWQLMKIQCRHWRRIQSKHNTKTAQVIEKKTVDNR